MTNIKTLNKPVLSLKTQTIAAVLAVVSAVVLPQIFHILGAVSGLGTALGEAFLPMHLPIILTGLLAGPFAGAAAGIASPILSFMISGMPSPVILPFMVIELCVYGLSSGLLRNVKMPDIAKVFSVQIIGRAVRAAAILTAVYAFGFEKLNPAIIYTSIITGLFGIILQLTVIPLAVFRIENPKKP